MGFLVLTQSQWQEIEIINSTSPINKIKPVTLSDGRMIIRDSLLSDSVTWSDFISVLNTLTAVEDLTTATGTPDLSNTVISTAQNPIKNAPVRDSSFVVNSLPGSPA